MPILLEKIMHDAKLNLDFKVEAAELPNTTNNVGLNFKVNAVKGMGEQRISMNTENLFKKVSAFALLTQVSEKMGTAFAPYVEPLLPVVTEHMTFAVNKTIRKHALKTFANMLVAVGEPLNVQYFQSAFGPIFVEPINNALSKNNNSLAKMLMKQLVNCLR
jgi:hypothetical protein